MKSIEKGYVYILTNPSFREDWIKIGKSSRPVDIRSKELDNTAVPLPFEIYATLATKKYHEVEKLVHKNIDQLTSLRIRHNREFFNIAPHVALEIFKSIASIIDDAVITEYRNHKPVSDDNQPVGEDTVCAGAELRQQDLHALQLQFWQAFREEAQSDKAFMKAFSLPKPLPRGYYTLSIGNSAFCISLSVTVRIKHVACELYIKSRKEYYHRLHDQNEQLEQEIGETLYWEEAQKDSRMIARHQGDITQYENWKEYFAWMRQTAIRIKEAYMRRVETMG